MKRKTQTVAWIADYPLEWMSEVPEPLRQLPKQEPSTWMPVLLAELERVKTLHPHVVVLRKGLKRSFSFERNGVVFHVVKVLGGFRASTFFWTDNV